MPELSPKVLTNVLVLTTLNKEAELRVQKLTESKDFWDQCETPLILKMKEMGLGDLINLLWSAVEVGRGSDGFFKELESNLVKKILKVKVMLVSCKM